VAGTVVAVELVHLAVLLELGLVLVHLLGARRAVVVAEYAEQRQQRSFVISTGATGVLALSSSLPITNAAAPELDAGVDVLPLAGIDEGVPATRTGAEKCRPCCCDWTARASTSLRPRYRRPSGRRKCVVSAHFGGDVVAVALARTLIEVKPQIAR